MATRKAAGSSWMSRVVVSCPDHVVDEHVGRVEGQEHRRLLLGGVDQPLDHLQHRRVMVELEEGQLGPIGRRLDFGLAREGQLELDLHEIHAGVAEVLQMLVHRRLSQVVDGVEVEEERRRDAGRLGFRVDDAEEKVSLVHADSCLVWSHRRARRLVHHIAFRSVRRSDSLPQRGGVPQDRTNARCRPMKKEPPSVENGPRVVSQVHITSRNGHGNFSRLSDCCLPYRFIPAERPCVSQTP